MIAHLRETVNKRPVPASQICSGGGSVKLFGVLTFTRNRHSIVSIGTQRVGKRIRFVCHKKIPKPLEGLGIRNAGDGGRTHTVSPPTDFESVSSANSNTPAYVGTLLVYQPHAKLSRHPRRDFADKFSDFFCQKALTNGFHAAIIISVA